MYIGSTEAKIQSAIVARKVTDLAGFTDFPFVKLNAVSEAQEIFAGDVRLHAVAQMWSKDIDKDYQTSEMAKAVIAACNRHAEAKFWLDNKNTTFANLLGDDIDAEMGE